jgi:ABC-type phosphate transport system substrate-binding protein
MRTRLLALALLFVVTTGATARRSDVNIVVVVNAANPTNALPRAKVAQIFLRQTGEWENGTEILPVDQIERSPAHIAFVRTVLGQSVSTLRRYWQERIFSGNESPPPDRVTDADVLTYVRSNSGAIGYVAAGTDLGTGIKVLVIP